MATNIVVPVFQELVEYLAQKATPEEVLAFKVSEAAQRQAEELTERNKAGTLTPEEAVELQQLLEFDLLVSRLKAKAAKRQS